MLSLNDLTKAFGRSQILTGVSLAVKPGRAVCVAGKNASGKTTLLKMACGMLKPDSGSVSSDGRIAFVPQEPAILPELSVADNLKLWYASQNKSGPHFSPDSLETKLGLREHRRKKAGTLSGGMKKRLSIASALVKLPQYLLLDEPFASLDAVGCKQLIALLEALKKAGVGILFTSHEAAHISRVADELLLIRDGAIAEARELSQIPPEQLQAHVFQLLFGSE